MCYGTCKYEKSDGSCRVAGRFPADAACLDGLFDDEEPEAEEEENEC